MKHSIKNPFSLAGKTAAAARIRKIRRKLVYTYFQKFCPPQEKNPPNKSTKFVINNTFPLARMKDSLKNAISLDRKATSIRISI